MRSWLRWALGISTVVTLVVVTQTGDDPPSPAPLISSAARARLAQVDRLGGSLATNNALPLARPASAASTRPHPPAIEWPAELPRQMLATASRDPFQTAPPPTPPTSAVVNSAAPPVPVETSPVVPPMRYRYLGQVTDPDGKRVILIAKGDREIAASPGTALEDGFLIQSIQAKTLALIHVATNTPFEIRIPDAHDSTAH